MTPRIVVIVLALQACGEPAPLPGVIAERGWSATEIVVGAGEQAPTCPAAGIAMDRQITLHRRAFVDALALDHDRTRLEQATAYLEARQERYRDLEDRMVKLSERCPDDASVQAAFRRMESP